MDIVALFTSTRPVILLPKKFIKNSFRQFSIDWRIALTPRRYGRTIGLWR